MSGRYRSEENSLLTKHVVAAGRSVKDAGSTPAASTIILLNLFFRLPVAKNAKDLELGGQSTIHLDPFI